MVLRLAASQLNFLCHLLAKIRKWLLVPSLGKVKVHSHLEVAIENKLSTH
jgi:hypothetical protein